MKELFKFSKIKKDNLDDFGIDADNSAKESVFNVENIEDERKEEKENLSNKAENFIKDLIKDKPVKLIGEIANLLKQGDINKVPEVISECPDIAEFQQIMLQQFNKYGVLNVKDGLVIVDIEYLKKFDYNNFRHNLPVEIRGDSNKLETDRMIKFDKKASYFGKGKKSETLFYTFNNLPVVSKEDFVQGKDKPKDLFYIPATAKAAFDIGAIKKTDFYLSLVDLMPISTDTSLLAKNQEYFDKSAYVALMIYHPKYGDGYRNENDGKLYVKYADGEYRPMSTNFFKQYSQLSLGGDERSIKISHPQKFFDNTSSTELIKNGLLRPTDFNKFHSTKLKPYELKTINPSGYTTIHNSAGKAIRYYVGKGQELASNPQARVIKINEEIGAVLNTDETEKRYISHYFHLTNYDNPDLLTSLPSSRKTSQKSIVKIADKSITKTTAYQSEKLTDEADPEQKSLAEFSTLLKKTNAIRQATGVDLLTTMADESHWKQISSALIESAKSTEEISQFISKYGAEQLPVFAGSDVTPEEFDKYISLGKNLEQSTAEKLLTKYNDLLNLAKQTDESLIKKIIFEKDTEDLKPTNEIIKRAKEIILEFADKSAQAKISNESSQYINLIKKLDEIKNDIILFASVFKFASKKGIELPDIKGVELKKIMASDLSDKDRQEILRIFKNNRTNYPTSLLKHNTEQLQQSTHSGDDRFYTMKVNEELTSFIRYKDLPDGNVYVGSFNVRPEAKSSAIGDALFKTTLEEEGKNKIIEGVVYLKHPQFDSYIKYLESLGFKVVGEIDDYEGTGEKFYKIERQPNTQTAIEKSAA